MNMENEYAIFRKQIWFHLRVVKNSEDRNQVVNNYGTRLSKISWLVSGEQINYFPKPKLPFFTSEWSLEGEKRGSFTHVDEQNIICSQTQLDDIAHEQTIICRQSRGGLSANE